MLLQRAFKYVNVDITVYAHLFLEVVAIMMNAVRLLMAECVRILCA